MTKKDRKPETKSIRFSRSDAALSGAINPPIVRTSTVPYENLADMRRAYAGRYEPGQPHYGLLGTSTNVALEQSVAELEGGHGTVSYPSGLAAICATLCSFLKAGDHLLMVDSVYYPTREFCENVLKKFAVDVTYYDPLIGGAIADLFLENTRLIFLESPGSGTFEIQDLRALFPLARKARISTAIDNTWATPLFLRPLELGADIVIHAATKYICGHADVMMGLATANEEHYRALRSHSAYFGYHCNAEDAYLALRGLRTLSVRLQRHQSQALALAGWLEARPEIAFVRHPGLTSHPQHDLWARDFSGATGLFSAFFAPCSLNAFEAFVNSLELFAIGSSWGGYESLVLPFNPVKQRSATTWDFAGPGLRIHAGLENIDDLIADLENAFSAFATHS